MFHVYMHLYISMVQNNVYKLKVLVVGKCCQDSSSKQEALLLNKYLILINITELWNRPYFKLFPALSTGPHPVGHVMALIGHYMISFAEASR